MSTSKNDQTRIFSIELPSDLDFREGADFTLQFPDGTSLRAHSYLLRLASPFFKKMFDDVNGEKTSVMLKDDPTDWSMLLSGIHPDGAPYFYQALSKCGPEGLKRIVSLGRKYATNTQLRWVDENVRDRVRQQREAFLSRPDHRGHGNSGGIGDMKLLELLDWAARSGLDLSFKECVAFLSCRFEKQADRRHVYGHPFAGATVAEIGSKLIEDGFREYGLDLMREILQYVSIQ